MAEEMGFGDDMLAVMPPSAEDMVALGLAAEDHLDGIFLELSRQIQAHKEQIRKVLKEQMDVSRRQLDRLGTWTPQGAVPRQMHTPRPVDDSDNRRCSPPLQRPLQEWTMENVEEDIDIEVVGSSAKPPLGVHQNGHGPRKPAIHGQVLYFNHQGDDLSGQDPAGSGEVRYEELFKLDTQVLTVDKAFEAPSEEPTAERRGATLSSSQSEDSGLKPQPKQARFGGHHDHHSEAVRLAHEHEDIGSDGTGSGAGLSEGTVQTETPQEIQAPSNLLDSVSAAVISINAVILGVAADRADLNWFWEKLEYVFTAFFASELLYKMKKEGLPRFFINQDWHWNNFDFVVVLVAFFDIVSSSVLASIGVSPGIIKMARLGRLARLVRLLRFKIFHELKMMIQGVIAGLRVLFWAVVLLFFFIYLVGVMTRTTIGTSELHHFATTKSFESVPKAMFTLFRCFTDGCSAYDGSPLTVHLFEYYGGPFMILYILIFLFVTIGIFNLIMAIFIDNVMVASIQRKQKERGQNAVVMEVRLRALIVKLARKYRPDQDEDEVVVTRDVFEDWLHEKELLTMLDDLDIGTSNKNELFDVIDCDLSGELEVAEIMSGLMKLRGPPDKSDAVASLLGIRYMTKMLESVHNKILEFDIAGGDSCAPSRAGEPEEPRSAEPSEFGGVARPTFSAAAAKRASRMKVDDKPEDQTKGPRGRATFGQLMAKAKEPPPQLPPPRAAPAPPPAKASVASGTTGVDL
eukprot:TRINITY_DN6421_c1_g2_i1.p1 TRINITY_DN6421_c1_g2~~TRINITY_DN6421_c1_g2_i1.p1  ORF type:complete len:743 (-),score=190.41 TRINITY_DN6421_c1_g2_i1:237-2465(-)